MFNILNNGTLVVTGVLDFERQSTYTLLIVAEDTPADGGTPRTFNATLPVHISDRNEAPEFVAAVCQHAILDNLVQGMSVVTVVARDIDAVYNTLSYSVGGATEDLAYFNAYFQLNSATGAITANAAVDLRGQGLQSKVLTFSVTAADNGVDGSLNTTTQCTFTIYPGYVEELPHPG